MRFLGIVAFDSLRNRRALESVFSTYNAHRETYVLLFTDGSEQIESMSLCDGDAQTEIVAKLLRAGIVIQPMLLKGGDYTPSGVSCIRMKSIFIHFISFSFNFCAKEHMIFKINLPWVSNYFPPAV